MEELPDTDGLDVKSDLSLDSLSAAFAAALRAGKRSGAGAEDDFESLGRAFDETAALYDQVETEEQPFALRIAEPDETPDSVSPVGILEAMLFVGRPDGAPLTAAQAAAAMQGVEPDEVHPLVARLNARYLAEGCPYEIESAGAGYRMALRREFGRLREKFFGRMKAARLSQSAIDVLSLVAYNQPISQQEMDKLRDKHSATVLAQLVRRRLLRVDRDEQDARQKWYRTTPRFLELLGLESLEDLPRSYDVDPLM